MQAVILAGGLGTRLWPLTREVPKPMVPVAGVPYLEHQIRYLARHGIHDIVVLTGYLGEQIEAYFSDGRSCGVSIRYSREIQPLGTGGALRHADALLDEDFLLVYGDSFLPIDYANVMAELRRHPTAEGVVVVYDNALGDTSVRNNIALAPSGVVEKYDKSSAADPDLRYVEAGVLALRKSILRFISEGAVSLETQVFPQLIVARSLIGYPTTQRFYDIGTPDRLAVIEQFFRHDYHTNTLPH